MILKYKKNQQVSVIANNFPIFSSEASYGSHTNTNRMLETSSHMGSKHLLTFAGPNGVAHTNLMNGMNFEGGDEEKMEEYTQGLLLSIRMLYHPQLPNSMLLWILHCKDF